MMTVIQTHMKHCLLALMLGLLFWGTIDSVQAGPTRSRFDRSYPSISRMVDSEALRTTSLPVERTVEETLVERWTMKIPPWHQVAMNLQVPRAPGGITRFPLPSDSIRDSVDTERVGGGDDEDDEPALTDYDYQEWLSATVAPDRDMTP